MKSKKQKKKQRGATSPKWVVLGINQSSVVMPRKYIQEWVSRVLKELNRRQIKAVLERQNQELTLVFLNSREARKLNKSYRNKDYATDVLSFESQDPLSVGELVLCPKVIHRQSIENGWSFRQELSYLILHGILHLLGFDHETNKKEAQKMFALQDSIFEKLF